ncbi:MAG: hypothetical protein WHT46_09900, partial [Candidatus Geothermincolales bacterium]
MRVGVVGASGYTGAELMRLLAAHPEVEVTLATAQAYAGKRVGELYPHLRPYAEMTYRAFDPDEAVELAEECRRIMAQNGMQSLTGAVL